MILIVLLYVLFGSAFTFGSIAVSYINPLFFIGIRMTIAGILLLAYERYKSADGWKIRRSDWRYFAQTTGFLIFTSYTLEFWALQFVTGAKASLIFNISPFITALAAHIVLREYLTRKQWLGLIIGCIGLIPILMNQGVLEQFSFHIGFVSLPEFMLICSVVCAAYGWVVVKQLLIRYPYSPFFVNGFSMFWGGIGSFLASFLVEGRPHLIVYDQSILGLSAYSSSLFMLGLSTGMLILLANIIGFNLYGFLLKRYSATFVSFVGFVTPLFTAIFDWVLLGRMVTGAFFVSMFVIVIGLYFFYQDELTMSKKI